ncbi:MAG TPA: hypothetical protein VMT68_20455 [Caulobacteraceae bacterium]|nr:hypothetical protein [Caulobacteraceae bacterium]
MPETDVIETDGEGRHWEAPRLWVLELAEAETGALVGGPGDGGGATCS